MTLGACPSVRSERAATRRVLGAVGLVAGCLLALGGCGGSKSVGRGMDAAVRDATVVDGSALLDAWPSDGGASSDAAPSDAGTTAMCPTPTCDPRQDAGSCPSGTCALTAATPGCVTGVGDAGEGDPCGTTTDCTTGLGCFAQGDGGICGRLCCPGDDAACGTGEQCAGTGMLVDGVDTPWGRCLASRSCDVLHPAETCEPGEGCYIVSATGDTECLRAGSADVGGACTAQNDCAAGLFCGGLTHMACLRICSLADAGAAPCPPTEGDCRAYVHSPAGTGLCTVATTAAGH